MTDDELREAAVRVVRLVRDIGTTTEHIESILRALVERAVAEERDACAKLAQEHTEAGYVLDIGRRIALKIIRRAAK